MDLEFSEEQLMLRDTVARLCADFHDGVTLRRLERDEKAYVPEFWQALSELGLCGLLLDEEHGGIGLGMLECIVAHEEFGRSLAPSPHFVSAVLSATLLGMAGSEAEKSQWLPLLASGEKIMVPAWQEMGAGPGLESLRAEPGEKILVPFANSADAFLVPVRDASGSLQLCVVPAGRVVLRAMPNHADQSLWAVSFPDGIPAPEQGAGTAVASIAWDESLLRGQVALAAQCVGGASAILELAIEYAKQRQQFGQPIGAFQSIAHYLADRSTELEGARYLVYQAAWACDRGESWQQLALMARLQAAAVFRRATVTGVQVHGGMGFSAEADPQLYYRRAKHLQLMHWDPSYLEKRIAAEVFA